jgi:hypothetical protein
MDEPWSCDDNAGVQPTTRGTNLVKLDAHIITTATNLLPPDDITASRRHEICAWKHWRIATVRKGLRRCLRSPNHLKWA